MTPISLMPPVDYCPSCEGRKAEHQAQQIGAARAEQAELQAAVDTAAPSTGAPPPLEDGTQAGATVAKSIDDAVQTVLAPDLAVQASFARPEIGQTGTEEAALRLRTAQAYQGV